MRRVWWIYLFCVAASLFESSANAEYANAASPLWSVRLFFGKDFSWQERDVSQVSVTLTKNLILVSRPYVPSSCGDDTKPFEGYVSAYNKTTGKPVWTGRIWQTSWDQSSFLEAYATKSLVAFFTLESLRVLRLSDGKKVWEVSMKTNRLPKECKSGLQNSKQTKMVPYGSFLTWTSDENDQMLCVLRLTDGTIKTARFDSNAADRDAHIKTLFRLTKMPRKSNGFDCRRWMLRNEAEDVYSLGVDCDNNYMARVDVKTRCQSGPDCSEVQLSLFETKESLD